MPNLDTAWAEINLDNLSNNLNIVNKYIDKKVKILAVVKADAYGHGLCEIARTLSEEGVSYFGVASADEGLKLLNSGITVPILILRSVLQHELTTIFDAGLIPSINCICLAKEANSYGFSHNRKVKIHIRIDTGSDGDGVPVAESESFFQELSKMEWIETEGLYTHLTSAYALDDQFVKIQISNFQSVIEFTKKVGLYIPLVHAASSPAIFKYPEAHFNMVRVGTALYGLPFIGDSCVQSLKPVMQLKSRVLCIKEFENGYRPGYGADYQKSGRIRIAYVAVGYADASFLLGAQNLNVLIGGRFAKLYGNAYMDVIQVDITELSNIQIGDEVVIFGAQKERYIGVLTVADACRISKVNCESICFLGKRVVRNYTQNVNTANKEICTV